MSSKNKVLTEFKNNNFKLALKYLEEIIKVEPNDENNYNFKGIILQLSLIHISEPTRPY